MCVTSAWLMAGARVSPGRADPGMASEARGTGRVWSVEGGIKSGFHTQAGQQ